jgi:hypothetical protein
MGKKVPEAPDYEAVAERQADSSREVTRDQTYANRPTQITPWGELRWETERIIDPATGAPVTQWTQRSTLDPAEQASLDSQQAITQGRSQLALGMLGRTQDEFGPMMDWSNLTQLQDAPKAPQYSTAGFQGIGPMDLQTGLDYSGAYQVGDPNAIRQQAEDAIYNRSKSRLDPQWQQRMGDLEVQLRNQGLSPGDEAYQRAMGNAERARTDAYQTATNESIMGGGAESDRLFGQMMGRRGQDVGEINAQGGFRNDALTGLFGQQGKTREQQLNEMLRLGNASMSDAITAANFQGTRRQQEIAEQMQRRGFSLNEINAILTGQQIAQPSMPGFNQAERSEATQYLRAADSQFAADSAVASAQNQGMQNLMSGLSSVGGAAMMSDIRLKTDIERIGSIGKLGLYRWNWNRLAYLLGVNHMPTVGVIAQEVLLEIPHAVQRLANGLYAVDYDKLTPAEAA